MKTVGNVIQEELGKDIVSDELAAKITEMFDNTVNEQVNLRVEMAVDNELQKMDEAHAEMLENLLSKLDADHTSKMKKLVESIDEDFAKKLSNVAKKYDRELNESATEYSNKLNKQVSDFLEMYLDKTFPQDMLKEAVENTRAVRALAKIRDLVGLDVTYVDNTVKEAIKEAHDTIDGLKKDASDKDATIAQLKEQVEAQKAQLVLEQKTAGLVAEKREFIMGKFAGRTADEIEQNFDYVLEMYNKNERDRREAMRTGSLTESRTLNQKVDRTPRASKPVITENVEDQSIVSESSDVNMCLEGLSDVM